MSTTTVIGLVALALLFGRPLLRLVRALLVLGLIFTALLVAWFFGLIAIPFSF